MALLNNIIVRELVIPGVCGLIGLVIGVTLTQMNQTAVTWALIIGTSIVLAGKLSESAEQDDPEGERLQRPVQPQQRNEPTNGQRPASGTEIELDLDTDSISFNDRP